ncbi:MAG: acetamidase/formamidase family protein [Candidatus Solibacter usitatus]|nr:acetamidase/formamidase family protein [Candidatus Solibacter usitatus]
MRLLTVLGLTAAFGHAADKHILKAAPETVVIGYYDAASPPALRIKAGDTVEIHTLGVARAAALEALGVPANRVQPELRAVTAANTTGRGHFLTGPVFVEGAAPGDALVVHIVDVKLAIDYSYNAMGANGVLADRFRVGTNKLIPLDRERGVAPFAPGVEVPLRPFFGSMGVAPPREAGRLSSTPPWTHAGNMDNRELTAGSTVYIPVHVPGALFLAGDGHAAQGDGEVDQTGLETSLVGTFRFELRKGWNRKWPRAETPTHYIAMGFDDDLNKAVRLATEEAVDWLMELGKLSRADAYMLASVAVDLHITQLVDVNKGVHAMIPKSLFIARAKE